MKHLQELGIGLKVIDFSHNHNCGGDSDWTKSMKTPGEQEN